MEVETTPRKRDAITISDGSQINADLLAFAKSA